MSGGKRRLSIIRELGVLASSVGSLRALAAHKLNGAFHGENITELAVVMAGALHVLQARILLLHNILVGAANPASILCPSNEEESARSGPYVLPEWSNEEQVRRAMLALQADCYRKAQEQIPSKKSDDKRRSN